MNFVNVYYSNCGVYRIINKNNNNCYIGSSNNLKRRYCSHLNTLIINKNKCSILQRAFNKYGQDSFVFQVILCCDPKDRLYYEQQLIDELKPKYNIYIQVNDGPLRNVPMSNITKQKLRASHQGTKLTEQHKLNISLSLRGHKVSDETKQKQSNVRKGIKFKEETLRKMSIAKKGKPWSENRRLAQNKKIIKNE